MATRPAAIARASGPVSALAEVGSAANVVGEGSTTAADEQGASTEQLATCGFGGGVAVSGLADAAKAADATDDGATEDVGVGTAVGVAVGATVGLAVGLAVGASTGPAVGTNVGVGVGIGVGAGIGAGHDGISKVDVQSEARYAYRVGLPPVAAHRTPLMPPLR